MFAKRKYFNPETLVKWMTNYNFPSNEYRPERLTIII